MADVDHILVWCSAQFRCFTSQQSIQEQSWKGLWRSSVLIRSLPAEKYPVVIRPSIQQMLRQSFRLPNPFQASLLFTFFQFWYFSEVFSWLPQPSASSVQPMANLIAVRIIPPRLVGAGDGQPWHGHPLSRTGGVTTGDGRSYHLKYGV